MIDLVCLVADKNMEAAVSGLLARPEALGIRAITTEMIVHPRRDPGCFHESVQLLRGYRASATHALVILDFAWDGVPAPSGADVERLLEEKLRREGMATWSSSVVIDPELEVWVFSDSPHVASVLGWAGRAPDLRLALEERSLWEKGASKPTAPKEALEWALREMRRPRSSSIYRELAMRVSTRHCQDRSFLRLRYQLRGWFPRGAAEFAGGD